MPDEPTKAQDEIELAAGDKKLRVRGSDLLGIFQVVLLAVVAYGGWMHVVDAKDDSKTVTQAIKDQTAVQRDQLNAQRESNCLNRLTPEQKKQPKEIEFCRDLGKGR